MRVFDHSGHCNYIQLILGRSEYQCCRYSRNIAQVAPKIIYFYHQKNILKGYKYPKIDMFNFEKDFTARYSSPIA